MLTKRELNLRFKKEWSKRKTSKGKRSVLRRYFRQGGSKSWANLIVGNYQNNDQIINQEYEKVRETAR